MWDFFIFNNMGLHRWKLVLKELLLPIIFFGGVQVNLNAQGAISVLDSEELETFAKLNVHATEISESLSYLASDDLEGRKTGTKGAEEAASYIERILESYKIPPYFETYRDSFRVSNKSAYNVVGFIEGKDPELKNEYVLLGAHYDHIGIAKGAGNDLIANGANDNASGTVTVIELAKLLSGSDNKRSILVVLFAAEEDGLLGSEHLAKRLKEKDVDIYTMIGFEMTGVPMQSDAHTAYITGYNMSNLAEKFNEYSRKKVLGFLPQAKKYQLFKRSDNYPFYTEFGVPSQTISCFDFSNFDFYHHVKDESDKMDFNHMERFIETIFPAIYTMANTEKKEIKLID